MSKIAKPGFLFTYYNPFNKDAPGLVQSYFSYLKDVSLVDYGAKRVTGAIEAASREQIEVLNRQTDAINKGFKVLDQRLTFIAHEQVATNILLADIKELLKLPDSEKQRILHIEKGLKYFSKISKDASFIKDAVREFESAKKLCPEDWFTLYFLGNCYLYHPETLEIDKAKLNFEAATKYCNSDESYQIYDSYESSYFMMNSESEDRDIPEEYFDEKYEKKVVPYFYLIDAYLSLAHISYIESDFAAAYDYSSKAMQVLYDDDVLLDSRYIGKIHFYRAKYGIRTRNIPLTLIIGDLEKSFSYFPLFGTLAANDSDLNVNPQIVEKANKFIVLQSVIENQNLAEETRKLTLMTIEAYIGYILKMKLRSIDEGLTFNQLNFRGELRHCKEIFDIDTKEFIDIYDPIKFIKEKEPKSKGFIANYIPECGVYSNKGSTILTCALYKTTEDIYNDFSDNERFKIFQSRINKFFTDAFKNVIWNIGLKIDLGIDKSNFNYTLDKESVFREVISELPNELSEDNIAIKYLLDNNGINTFDNSVKRHFIKVFDLAIQEEVTAEKNLAEDANSSKNKKEGCYIATAIYGSYNSPEVLILRQFRDQTLQKYILGRLFISTYYFVSPMLSKTVRKNKLLNASISFFLAKIVNRLRNE